MSLTFILGGARSGKSRHAETLAERHSAPWHYIATAQAYDAEMAERIALHRSRRGQGWHTLDAPHDLAAAVRRAPARGVVLVDCLTLWLTNRLLAEADLEAESTELCAAFRQRQGTTLVVSNETGLGIVPDNALARRFRDAQGRLNQKVAATADDVLFMVAGIPMKVK